MCVMSVIIDHGTTTWPPFQPNNDWELNALRQRVADLEEAMRKAKELDNFLGKEKCELDAKKKALKELADKFGVKINFPE